MKLIEVKNLNYKVGSKKILNNISFEFNEGEIVSVIGPSGCGKSSFVKMIAGVLNNHNTITYRFSYINFNKNFDDSRYFGYASNNMPFLFDDVYQELLFPLENLCVDDTEMQNRIKEIVGYFGYSYILDKKCCDLNGSEREVLRLLLALIHLPNVLVLDQLFQTLSRDKVKDIYTKLIDFCKRRNILLIYSTSNLEETLFSDKIIVINNGEIVMNGDTLSILSEDTNLKKLGLKLPFMVDLSLMFKFYEILDDIYVEMDDVVKYLWK